MAGGVGHDAILAGPEVRSIDEQSGIAGLFASLNELMFKISAIALVIAAVVLTGGVIYSHATQRGVAWQDEVTIYLIAGAIFLSAAAVQSKRGHIGIEVLDHLLSPRVNAARRAIIDGVVLFFCLFFAWKSGTLLHEAWVEGQTSQSVWGPPLWIPYLVLTIGMVLLALQLAFQVGQRSLIALIVITLAVVAFLLWARPPGKLITGLPQWQVGVAYCIATLVTMFSGMPIAFALGIVALSFMVLFMPAASVDTIAQNFYEEISNVIILAIPLFILKGAAIGRSNAGKDLYSALHAWLYRIPGGLGVANTDRVRPVCCNGRVVASHMLRHRVGRYS